MKKALALLCLIVAFSLFSVCVFASEDRGQMSSQITSFSVIDGKAEVKAVLSSDEMLDENIGLFSVFSQVERLYLPMATTKSGENIAFTFSVDTTDPSSIACGWCLGVLNGVTYERISDIFFFDGISEFSANKKEYPAIVSKKGLNVTVVSEADLLSVFNSTVDINLMSLIYDGTGEAISFVYGEKTYLVEKSELLRLDSKIKSLTLSGINIYGRLVFRDISGNYHPITEFDGRTISALLFFISERYSRFDSEYGFCGSYIFGQSINEEKNYFPLDILSCEEYASEVNYYLQSFESSLKSGYSNVRLFVSLSEKMSIPENQNQNGIFSAKEFLSALCNVNPEFDYGVSVTMKISSKEHSANNVEAENLSLFSDVSKKSKIIIEDYGFADFSDNDVCKNRFLSDWNLLTKNESVEAIIWGCQRDKDGRNDGLFSSSGTKNGIYSAFFSFISEAKKYSGKAKTANTELFAFSSSLCGFYPTNSASYIEAIEGDESFMRVAPAHDGSDCFFGCGRTLSSDILSYCKGISACVRLSSDGKAVLMVINGSNTYYCEKDVPSSSWENVYFDVTAFNSELDKTLPIYFKIGCTDENGNSGLILDVKSVSVDEKGLCIPMWAIITLIALALFSATALLIYILKAGKKSEEN